MFIDSSTINFFNNNEKFSHVLKKGEYSIVTQEGSAKHLLQRIFSFEKHPFIQFPFDSGVIKFNIIETNGMENILSIELEIFTNDTEKCKNIYYYIIDLLNTQSNKIRAENGSTIIYTKIDFKDFTSLQLSFKKIETITSTIFYEINFEGK